MVTFHNQFISCQAGLQGEKSHHLDLLVVLQSKDLRLSLLSNDGYGKACTVCTDMHRYA